MNSHGSKHRHAARTKFLATLGVVGTILIVSFLTPHWFFSNPMDREVGFSIYLPLPVAISVLCALVLRRLPPEWVWLLAWLISVSIYAGCWIAWRGVTSTLGIGLGFTFLAYLPVTGAAAMLARSVMRGRSRQG